MTIYQYLGIMSFLRLNIYYIKGRYWEYLPIPVSEELKVAETTANGTVLSAFSNPITVTGEVEFLKSLRSH